MILLLDIGNSRIKWGAWEAGAWRGRGACAVAKVERLAPVLAEHRPAWVGVCCVAGAATRVAVERLLGGLPVHWLVAAATEHGIVNRYTRPETLGADRYAGLVACRRRGHAPCVLASAGTALTVDALAGEGEFLGGVIVPGAGLLRQALATGTAAVGTPPGSWQAFPRTTGDAVATGTLDAMAGCIEAMRWRLAGYLGVAPRVVLTGGDAAGLVGHLDGDVVVEADLVLEGMLCLARDLGAPGA
ncbi:MAG: type III pantothenate kinase [Gallionellaceae bacterium]|nr:type III pantothenate kinase [Gallionellaceae bacterium]